MLVLLSTRAEGHAIQEGLQYTVTHRPGGPMRLTEKEAAQLKQAFESRPDLCNLVKDSLAHQGHAGNAYIRDLLGGDDGVCAGPHDLVCILLSACSVPASKQSFSC